MTNFIKIRKDMEMEYTNGHQQVKINQINMMDVHKYLKKYKIGKIKISN